MILLGISAFYHDSSACLLINGEIIAAAQEERFTRKKNDFSYPINAINYVLKEANLSFDQINFVVYYEKPLIKFERLLETYINCFPKGFKQFRKSISIWIKEKLFLKIFLLKEFRKSNKKFRSNQLLFSEHHLSHAASAFYPSPFDKAVILVIDGVGEWASTSVMIGENENIKVVKEILFPNSLGLLYSAFTQYLGFRVNNGEYKVMGLAPYGKPRYKDFILKKLVKLNKDGSYEINQKYFSYSYGDSMINENFIKLFNEPIRNPQIDELNQFHMDIASSLQFVLEEILICMIKNLSKEFEFTNLCLAGGVALNCVANSKILNSNYFKKVWIQPASGDSGGSLGAALAFWYNELKNERNFGKDSMKGSLLGPQYKNDYIKKVLINHSEFFNEYSDDDILKITAKHLSEGKIVGWFQGRMEFGPRSLGNRAILADPRSNKIQRELNLKIKFRESFRPFAPSILKKNLSEWFETKLESPYMLLVSTVKEDKRLKISNNEEMFVGLKKLHVNRSIIPAVTHVDYSSRIQTVEYKSNPFFYKLINEFKKITNVPMLVNTSFNVRGEPIVCSPKDAINCFNNTNLDILVIGNFILRKNEFNKN